MKLLFIVEGQTSTTSYAVDNQGTFAQTATYINRNNKHLLKIEGGYLHFDEFNSLRNSSMYELESVPTKWVDREDRSMWAKPDVDQSEHLKSLFGVSGTLVIEDEITEAKNKTHSTTTKKKNGPMKIELGKPSIGHQSHITGSGAHGDKRQRRQKTRADRNRSWRKESD